MSPWTYYWLSVLVLAALLLWPAAKLVWTLSVRRLERKLGRALSAEERQGQLRRAWFLAILVCLVFSALLNYQILDMAAYGMAAGWAARSPIPNRDGDESQNGSGWWYPPATSGCLAMRSGPASSGSGLSRRIQPGTETRG
jgi:hypothetical protein